MARLKRAMRSWGPAREGALRPAGPLVLSAAVGRGVADVLRTLVLAIDAERAPQGDAAKQMEWQP